MAKNADVKNAENALESNVLSSYTPFTINEVVNVLGENYVTTAKRVKALAVRDNLRVSEKLINNRPVTTYYLSTKELQELKNTFTSLKVQKSTKNENVINAEYISETDENKNKTNDDIIVKYCKLIEDNNELQKNYDELKQAYQKTSSELVQANADLTISKSELKYIEDKQKTFEGFNAQLTQEKIALQKQVKNRNIALLVLGAFILISVTVALTIFFIR